MSTTRTLTLLTTLTTLAALVLVGCSGSDDTTSTTTANTVPSTTTTAPVAGAETLDPAALEVYCAAARAYVDHRKLTDTNPEVDPITEEWLALLAHVATVAPPELVDDWQALLARDTAVHTNTLTREIVRAGSRASLVLRDDLRTCGIYTYL